MADIKPNDSEIKYLATCNTDAMNIRLGPSLASRIATKAPTTVIKGQTINVYDIDSAGWMKHWHERLECFVYTRKSNQGKSVFTLKSLLEINTTASEIKTLLDNEVPIEVREAEKIEKENNQIDTIGYAVVTDKVTGSALNFRVNPSISASTYYQKGIKRYYAYPGEKYEIYEISDDGNWVKVMHPDTGDMAWLAIKRLIFNNNGSAKYLDITLYDISTEPTPDQDPVEIIDKTDNPKPISIDNQDQNDAMYEYYNALFDGNWYEYNGGHSSHNGAKEDVIEPTGMNSIGASLSIEGHNNLNSLISAYNNKFINNDTNKPSADLGNYDNKTNYNSLVEQLAAKSWKEQLNINAPSIVQNESNFPRIVGRDPRTGVYKYDYSQNYYETDENGGIGDDKQYDSTTGTDQWSTFGLLLKNLRRALDIPSMDSYNDTYKKQLHMYNRFKLPTTNDQLTNSFSHIFFTKPDLNIFGKNGVLDNATGGIDSFIQNMYKMCPTLFSQLTLDNQDGIDQESGSRFMMYLSNKAKSIDISDENLEVSEYAETHTGFKLVYGKNTLKARQSGDLTMSFVDDKRLTIYKLVRIWLDYISGCYRGLYLPKEEYLTYHALDYAASIYYILCAEDGETIIYWAKYYGVFPVNVPSSQYSKAEDYTIKLPKGNYSFKYTIKEEMTPMIIHEFNSCTSPIHYKYGSTYVPNFEPETLTAGTWVGTPFITLEQDSSGAYIYKLRFRPYATTGYKEPSSTRD